MYQVQENQELLESVRGRIAKVNKKGYYMSSMDDDHSIEDN